MAFLRGQINRSSTERKDCIMQPTVQVLSYVVAACLAVLTLFAAVKMVQVLREGTSWAYRLEKVLRIVAVLFLLLGAFGVLDFGCWLVSHPLTMVNGHPHYTGVSLAFQHRVFITALAVGYSCIPLFLMGALIGYFRRVSEREPVVTLSNILS